MGEKHKTYRLEKYAKMGEFLFVSGNVQPLPQGKMHFEVFQDIAWKLF